MPRISKKKIASKSGDTKSSSTAPRARTARSAVLPAPHSRRAASQKAPSAAGANRVSAGRNGHCFGSHLSIAGGMHHAIEAALALQLNTVQVFVKNQRQWKATPFREDDLKQWHVLRATPGFCPPIAHATYLINLASGDDALRERSRQAFAEELERCDTLAIPYLVIHPGAAVDAPVEEAVERVAVSLNEIFAERPTLRTIPLLEATAGQGSTLGRTMEQLGAIIGRVRESQRVGVCIDTCHVFAAGYDIRDKAEYTKMLAAADQQFGVERIRCWHLNDSKGGLGSRVDRHEHIGRGQIGPAGFANVLRDKRFVQIPMILETPKETAPDGRDWDTVNIEVLRGLE